MTKVSVITVCKNAEDYIEETIKSVVSQTYNNIELIVIDGKSTDKTLEIINKYKSEISYFISELDSGLYDAMNKGIEKSTGDWIIFLNAGDYLNNIEILENIFSKIDINNYEVVYGDEVRVNTKLNKEENFLKARNIEDLWRGMVFNHNCMFAKRSSLLDSKFDTKYKIIADFVQIFTFYYIDKKSFLYIPEVIAKIETHGYSKTKKAYLIRTLERYKFVKKYKNDLEFKKHYLITFINFFKIFFK